jgi:hypothetical protein
VVPLPIYPESTHSSSSGSLNKLLKTKLREHALVLRDLSARLRSSGQISEVDIIAALRSKKEQLLSEVYGVMTATLGVPPQPNDKFVWDYYDKDGKAGRWEGSAKQFYAVCPRRFSSRRVRCSSWLAHLGILEQELSSFRLFLSYQRSSQWLLEVVYSRQTRQCLGWKTCPLFVEKKFILAVLTDETQTLTRKSRI